MSNSARYWFPRISAFELPVPRTVFIPYAHHACLAAFDGQPALEVDRLIAEVRKYLPEIGLPAFVRTDMASAKHRGPSAYRIEHDGDVPRVVYATLEDNEMKLWMSPEQPSALILREFLELPAPFSAFHGLPIAREWRYFADGERVHKKIPYWPEEAIAQTEDYDRSLPSNWRSLLASMYAESPPSELDALSIKAAAACGGDVWSVDWAESSVGWKLLDMAMARDSWGWSE